MPNLTLTPGLNQSDLECVMLDLPEFDIVGALGDAYNPDDLYYDDEQEFVTGMVADSVAHVTLLYGIHPSHDYETKVLALLENWTIPTIFLESVGYFEQDEYDVIYMRVQPTAALVSANRVLQELDYTNDYPTYIPHMTVAYVKKGIDKKPWVEKLNAAFANKAVTPYGLNLGL